MLPQLCLGFITTRSRFEMAGPVSKPRRPLSRPQPRRLRAPPPVEQLLVFNLRGLGMGRRLALYMFYEAWRLIQGLIQGGSERENSEDNDSGSMV